MTCVEAHLLTSNSRNSSKRNYQGNWIGKTQSNEEIEHDQQGKEKCTGKNDLMEAKCLNCDQMDHHAQGYIEPKKILSNIS